MRYISDLDRYIRKAVYAYIRGERDGINKKRNIPKFYDKKRRTIYMNGFNRGLHHESIKIYNENNR